MEDVIRPPSLYFLGMRVENILDKVCSKYNVAKEDILGPSRKRELFYIRVIFTKIMRENTDLYLSQIGELINRNYSTLVYYLKIYKDLMCCDYIFVNMCKKANNIVSELKETSNE